MQGCEFCLIQDRFPMTDYWMRWVDFARLRDLLVLIIESPEPLRPATLYRVAIASGVFVSSSGKPFSPSTFYHHHLTLEKLGMVERRDGGFVSNLRAEEQGPLLDSAKGEELTDSQRCVFSDRVVCNDSCYDMFFGIFIRSRRPTTVQDFIELGDPVVLELRSYGFASGSKQQLTICNSLDRSSEVVHHAHNAVQAIHFGMRRWGVSQLRFLDQIYRVGEGYLIFPVEIQPQVDSGSINRALIESLEFSNDWATPRVGDLLFSVASRLRVPLKRVRSVLNEWLRIHAGLISPITVSDRMILAGQSKQMRRLVLESFLSLPSGEHVSHLQVHRTLADRMGLTFEEENSYVR